MKFDHDLVTDLSFDLKELGLGQPKIKPVEKTASDVGDNQYQVASVKQEAPQSLVAE